VGGASTELRGKLNGLSFNKESVQDLDSTPDSAGRVHYRVSRDVSKPGLSGTGVGHFLEMPDVAMSEAEDQSVPPGDLEIGAYLYPEAKIHVRQQIPKLRRPCARRSLSCPNQDGLLLLPTAQLRRNRTRIRALVEVRRLCS
jgi:hypothetical protein